jgi:hypothetical protein
MPKSAIAIGLAGLLLAGVSATGQAASILPPSKTAIIEALNSNITEARWRRCWVDRWGRRRCHWCWRDRWGRVRCG